MPYIDIELVLSQDEQIRVHGIHPIPPVGFAGFQARNQMIREAAERVQGAKLPTIVAGDFNATMWSGIYKEFLEQTALIDPRENNGIIPTWPTAFRFPLIPIDHFLHSNHFAVNHLRAFEVRGSDHRGLLVELTLLE